MSKGLEALHHPRIKSAKVDISTKGKHDIGYMFFNDTKQYAAIEKELKEYEKMKAIKGTTTFDKAIEDTLINACPNVAKKLKALEIIKKKPFNTVWFVYYKDYEDYYENAEYADESKRLTEEEYELLTEVLL